MVPAPPHLPPQLDLRCYLVTGQGTARHIRETARAAAAGGTGVIQIRSKPISARDLMELAGRVAEDVARVNPTTRVLIDDRVDVAAALISRGVPVHGVHVGQDDLPVRVVRELLGPAAIIGLTTGTLDLVRSANESADVLDYIGAGPFRPTPTKDSGRVPIGLSGYPELVRASRLPVVAIGDVTCADATELAGTGVAGLAVCRELMAAADPRRLAAEIRTAYDAGAVGGPR